jgi:hypothetical protein
MRATQAMMRPIITKSVMTISGCPSVNEASRNVIDVCTDRTALAQTDGVRCPAKLSETCRAGCLVSKFVSMPLVGKRPDWNHLLDSSSLSVLKQLPGSNGYFMSSPSTD